MGRTRRYWAPTRITFDDEIEVLKRKGLSERDALRVVLNYLRDILQDSQEGVSELQNERLERGEIEDKGQSNVAIAGNNFQALVALSIPESVNQLVFIPVSKGC